MYTQHAPAAQGFAALRATKRARFPHVHWDRHYTYYLCLQLDPPAAGFGFVHVVLLAQLVVEAISSRFAAD